MTIMVLFTSDRLYCTTKPTAYYQAFIQVISTLYVPISHHISLFHNSTLIAFLNLPTVACLALCFSIYIIAVSSKRPFHTLLHSSDTSPDRNIQKYPGNDNSQNALCIKNACGNAKNEQQDNNECKIQQCKMFQ